MTVRAIFRDNIGMDYKSQAVTIYGKAYDAFVAVFRRREIYASI